MLQPTGSQRATEQLLLLLKPHNPLLPPSRRRVRTDGRALSHSISLSLLSFFWLHRVACGNLALRQGIEPAAPGVGAQSLNHRETREGPESIS